MLGTLSKKKLLLFGSLGVVFVLVIIFFVNKRSPENLNPLYVSGTAAINTQMVSVVNQSRESDQPIFFFTGSNIATIESEDIFGDKKSNSLFTEFPYGEVSKLAFDAKSKNALLRVDVAEDNEASLNIGDLLNPKQDSLPDQYWLFVQLNNSPQLFAPKIDNPLADAYMTRDSIYVLAYKSPGVSDLFKIPQKEPSASLLISQDIKATSILGVTSQDAVVTRGLNEVTSVLGNNKKTLKVGSESVLFDHKTNTLFVTEGGKYTIYDSSTLKSLYKGNLPSDSSHVFTAGDGTIAILDNLTNPFHIYTGTIEKTKILWERYTLGNEQKALMSSITSIQVIKRSPLTFVFTNINNELVLVSKNEDIKLMNSTIPKKIEVPGLDTIYSIGSNELNIYTPINSGVFQKTTNQVKENCSCDVNQIIKHWYPQIIDSDDFTGDGVPPEEQIQ